jgi:integrase
MANCSILKRTNKNGVTYLARVRQRENGVSVFSKSKTFELKSAAEKWARTLLHKIENNVENYHAEFTNCSLGHLIDAYIEQKNKSDKKLSRTAFHTFALIKRYPIAQLPVSIIQSSDIIEYCLARKNWHTNPSASTLSIDVSCLRKILKIAKSMFSIDGTDSAIIDAYPALYDLKRISKSKQRSRRLEGDEYHRLLNALLEKEKRGNCEIPYSDLFMLSILTCCRVGELCNLRWQDVSERNRTVIVRDRKNPNGSLHNNSELPLLGDALSIILRQPKSSAYIDA